MLSEPPELQSLMLSSLDTSPVPMPTRAKGEGAESGSAGKDTGKSYTYMCMCSPYCLCTSYNSFDAETLINQTIACAHFSLYLHYLYALLYSLLSLIYTEHV